MKEEKKRKRKFTVELSIIDLALLLVIGLVAYFKGNFEIMFYYYSSIKVIGAIYYLYEYKVRYKGQLIKQLRALRDVRTQLYYITALAIAILFIIHRMPADPTMDSLYQSFFTACGIISLLCLLACIYVIVQKKKLLISGDMFGVTITRRCHNLLAPYIKPGDTVVDATLGNGNDAAFLAECIGPRGTLYGFDIQKEAVEATEERLLTVLDDAHLYPESHENMDTYVREAPRVIMFNLGYLPGGRKDVTTLPETTLRAIEKGLELLGEGGVMSVITYKGHPGAREEHNRVTEFLSALPSRRFEVLSFLQGNRGGSSPELHLIQKKAGL